MWDRTPRPGQCTEPKKDAATHRSVRTQRDPNAHRHTDGHQGPRLQKCGACRGNLSRRAAELSGLPHQRTLFPIGGSPEEPAAVWAEGLLQTRRWPRPARIFAITTTRPSTAGNATSKAVPLPAFQSADPNPARPSQSASGKEATEGRGTSYPVFGASLLGPEEPVVARLKNRYLMQVPQSKSGGLPDTNERSAQIGLGRCFVSARYESVRVILDVDPQQ